MKYGINGVIILYGADGRSTGEAFALFDTEHERKSALELFGSKLKKFYIEVFEGSVEDLERTVRQKYGSCRCTC